MSRRPRAWAELGTPGGSKHAASPSVSGGNVSAPLSRHYTVSRLCHQCGTAQPLCLYRCIWHNFSRLSPTPMKNLLISQPMPMPRHKRSPCMQNIPYCTCTNIVTIPSKILPTIWRFKEGSGPVIARCICNLSPCSPPCLSVSCLPIPLGAVRSGCEDKCGH